MTVVTAIGAEEFSWWVSLVAMAGMWRAHLACNLIDDYFDYKADILKDRQKVVRKGIKAYTRMKGIPPKAYRKGNKD